MKNRYPIAKQQCVDFFSIGIAVGQYFQTSDIQPEAKRNSLRAALGVAIEKDAELFSQLIESYRTQTKKQRLKAIRMISILFKNLNAYCNGLENDGVKEVEYLNLLRRSLFQIRKDFLAMPQ